MTKKIKMIENPTLISTKASQCQWVPKDALVKVSNQLDWIPKDILHQPKGHSQKPLVSTKVTNIDRKKVTRKLRSHQEKSHKEKTQKKVWRPKKIDEVVSKPRQNKTIQVWKPKVEQLQKKP